MRRLFLGIALIAVTAGLAVAQSAEDIIRRYEKTQGITTTTATGRILIYNQFGMQEKTFKLWSRGADDSLIEFTSKDEAGQKILRTKKAIYLYYPDAEEVIRLQGAALRNAVAGSDMSYEDMTGGKSILDQYNVESMTEETFDGIACWVIKIKAKVNDIPYPAQKLWINKATYALRKSEAYSVAGKLLKIVDVLKYATVSGFVIPVHMVIQDALKKNTKTELILESVRINEAVDPAIFSLQNLSM